MNDFYELFYTKTGIDLHKYDLTTKIEATYYQNPYITKEMTLTPINTLINEYGNKTETYYEILEELKHIILNSQTNDLQINKVVMYSNYACLSLVVKEYDIFCDELIKQILYEFIKY